MRVAVLVRVPRPAFLVADPALAENGVHPLGATTREAEDLPAEVREQPAVGVVEPDDDVAPGLDQRYEALEAAEGIGRVVQHAVAEEHVKLLRLERRSEEVHLHEPDASEPVLPAERLAQSQ